MKTTTLGLCTLLFFSCTQEDFPGQAEGGTPCDYICFGLSPDGVAQTRGGARADADGYTSGRFVLRSADSADTLCVRTVVTDGIAGAEKAVTRGTPVSDLTTYGTFHVVCDRDDMPNAFFMDVDVTEKSGGLWGTEPTYYWPGAGPTLTFYAWAPGDVYTNPTKDLTFTYTVPDAAADQKDLLVAKTAALDGDYNQAVDLAFDHICTAVKFVVGSEMQAGTIESVTLKGVYNKGTYDMTTAEWDLTNSPLVDFTQTLDIQTDGNETDGTAITTGAGTLMMLPQTLPDGATVEVVFHDNVTGTDRTLSATIEGSDWPQGKTVTYKLSVTPEYEFELSENPMLDAHYEILQTKLVVSGVPDGQSWTITADNNATIQAQSDMNSWAQQGYWTEKRQETDASGNLTDIGSARGEASYSGTGSGDFPIAIFVPENTGDEKRSIALSISVNGSVVQTINIEQYAPSWYGSNIGCERLEGDMQPWGFYWSSDFKLVFDLTNCDENDRRSLATYVNFYKSLIIRLIANLIGIDIPDLSYVHMEDHGGILGIGAVADKITVNLGSLDAGNIAERQDDGQQNTRDIYNFEGIQLTNNIINRIQSVGGYTDDMMNIEGSGSLPTNNAAIACMKLNSWNVVTAQGEEVLTLTNGTLPEWYLPASGEITDISDAEHPLSGNYWTSTSVENSHEYSYKYDATGSISQERRDTELHVRAVRKKP